MGELEDLADAVRRKSARAAAPTPPPLPPNRPPAQDLDRVWTIHDRGRQFGPHTERELAMLLGTRQVSAEALVWRNDSPRWIPITNLVPAPPSAPMPHHQQVSAGMAGGPVTVNVVNNIPMTATSNGWGTASLALGIVSVLSFCVPFLSLPLAFIGAAAGGIGIAAPPQRSSVGTSVVGVVLCGGVLLIWFLIFVGVASMPTPKH